MSAALDDRLAALREVVEVARGRLEDEDVDAAEALVRRAGQRIGLGMEATVVGLAVRRAPATPRSSTRSSARRSRPGPAPA